MNTVQVLKYKINIFYLLLFFSFIFSILNSIYQINNFDNYKKTKILPEYHSMINGDIEYFYKEGNEIAKKIRDGENYFDTGGEYRRPYLPSRLFAFFSLIINKELYDENYQINKDVNKIYFLIFQSIIYYLLLYFLYKKILIYLPILNSQIAILFLALEPTLFMYHSSFWSESIFFSLQILTVIYFLKEKFNSKDFFLMGLLLGVLYLQRSVAIFYIIPVLVLFYFKDRYNIMRSLLFISLGYFAIHLLVGFHNYKRVGIFYSTSTQAKDGFYIYLAPNILANKLSINSDEALNILNEKKNNWVLKNNLNLEKETDRLKFYSYQKDEALKIILQNPIQSMRVILEKTIHFVIIDPLTHVYYFHRWNSDEELFYKSNDHKKWIIPRIIYSIIIYFVCFYGVISLFNKKSNRIFFSFLILSIFYFSLVQSWYGGTRYFAPILIYLSFFFSSGLIDLKNKLYKNN